MMETNILGQTIGNFGNDWRESIARTFIRKGVSPIFLTVAGLCANLLGGLLIGLGGMAQMPAIWLHLAAGIMILLAGIFDLLDDMVAQLSNSVTKFGVFADSVFDVYADLAIFAGTMTYFALQKNIVLVVVSAIACIGALMTRYTQARAESLLPGRYNAGYLQRPEWIAVVIAACLLNRLYVGMWVIAVFSNLATFHRIWDAHQTAFNMEHPERAAKGYI
jgi:CDP-diacylglycerol--glycerol-3-phosphate 3-phosphatidyltransferase